MIATIVAIDKNYGIGSKGDLLAHIPEDMKNFKKITTNNIVIMGRKTWDSLPNKPLQNRINIVITSYANPQYSYSNNTVFCNMDFVKSFLSSNKFLRFYNNVYIIGGGKIYKELLPFCEQVYITKILHEYEDVDTYFPNIDNMPEWEMTSESEIKEHNDLQYQFCIYDKVNDNVNE